MPLTYCKLQSEASKSVETALINNYYKTRLTDSFLKLTSYLTTINISELF